jgi:hypothetical protein
VDSYAEFTRGKFVQNVTSKQQRIEYRSDFLITAEPRAPRASLTELLEATDILLDVKGMITPDFELKQKLFIYHFKHHIYLVRNISQALTVLRHFGHIK